MNCPTSSVNRRLENWRNLEDIDVIQRTQSAKKRCARSTFICGDSFQNQIWTLILALELPRLSCGAVLPSPMHKIEASKASWKHCAARIFSSCPNLVLTGRTEHIFPGFHHTNLPCYVLLLSLSND